MTKLTWEEKHRQIWGRWHVGVPFPLLESANAYAKYLNGYDDSEGCVRSEGDDYVVYERFILKVNGNV
jgi:hypothetical protein